MCPYRLAPIVSVEDIWTYIVRTLTDPNSYKADVSGLAPAGEYDTEMGRITEARGKLIDALGTPANFMANISALLSTTHFDITEFEKCQVPVTENAAVTVTVVTADQSLGSKDIIVDIPTNATIISAIAMAKINIMNNSSTAQKIDLKFDVETVTLFDQDDVVGFGATDGASASYVIAEDASDEVTADGQTVTLESFATLFAAQPVIFSAQYYLFIAYKMG